MQNQYHVGILLFDYVDALDFVGPYEVFNMSTYKRSDVKKLLLNELQEKPFKVSTVSEDGTEVTIHHGLKVTPDFSFNNCPSFDFIVVPGGPMKAIEQVSNNNKIIEWIASYDSKLITSVCTGALFLAKSGVLKDKKATTNKAALRLLEKSFSNINVIKNVKYVDAGNVITAAGVSSGINMALYVIKKLLGEEAAKRTADTIEFSSDL